MTEAEASPDGWLIHANKVNASPTLHDAGNE